MPKPDGWAAAAPLVDNRKAYSVRGRATRRRRTAPDTRRAPPAAPGAPAPRPASPWRGILGGALLGLGLGALLSHFGIGGAFAGMISTILMIALLALAAMFIYRMFMRRKNGTG